jgi:small subunit ribosomal protein S15e
LQRRLATLCLEARKQESRIVAHAREEPLTVNAHVQCQEGKLDPGQAQVQQRCEVLVRDLNRFNLSRSFLLSPSQSPNMDSYDAEAAAELKRKRAFRKFSYRGYELDSLLDMSTEDFMKVVHARARRRFSRGLKRKPMGLIKKLRKAKKEAPANEKPAVVRTHLRDMLVVPEMCGSQIGVYSGKVFNNVDIRPEMIGHYLGMYYR